MIPQSVQLFTTVETSRRLRELGVTAPSFSMHVLRHNKTRTMLPTSEMADDAINWEGNCYAYCADELLPMILRNEFCNTPLKSVLQYAEQDDLPLAEFFGKFIIDALENKVLTAEQCNARALKPEW